jgi:pimeloyl-ACP methyl ester carboxylesterase
MTHLPVDLAYEEHGAGIPLMLVHGFPLNRSIWRPLLPLLESKFRLILPDLRGFGQSPAPEGAYSMRLLAEDLRALLDTLKIDRVVLAGHSMGGYVSLAFAQAYPHRLAGLALIATQAAADSPEVRASREKSIEELKRRGLKPLADTLAPRLTCQPALVKPLRELILKANPHGVIGALKGMAERPNAQEWLSTIIVPTVVIAGSEDIIIPIERPRLMTQLLGRAWLVEVNDAAHMPMMEQPPAVANAILQLISSL